MRTARPTSAASETPSTHDVAPADGACAAASERQRGAARDRDDARLAPYRDRFRDAAYYSTGRDWEDYAPAYRCGLDAFDARRPHSQRFGDIEAALAQAWVATRGHSRLGWAEARGAVLDAWLQQCDGRSGGLDRRRGARRNAAVGRTRSPVAAIADSDGIAVTDGGPAAAFTDTGRTGG